MELQEAILKRRSVRRFTEHYVSDEDLKKLLEAARWAPSWANTQVWEFVVVRDREIIRELTECYTETNPARQCSFACSALIAVCMKTKISGFKGGEPRTKFGEWGLFDLGLAVQNLCLTAHELGLGTVVVGSMDHDRMNAILKLPEGMEVAVTLPVGYPVPEPVKVPGRKELKDIAHIDRYGERFTKIY